MNTPAQDRITRLLRIKPLTPLEISKCLSIGESTAYACLKRMASMGKVAQREVWNFRTSKRNAQFFLTRQGMDV